MRRTRKNKAKATEVKEKSSRKCAKKKRSIIKTSKKSTVVVGNRTNASKKMKNKRLNYSLDDVDHALTALINGSSLRKAAAAYGVPFTTLVRKKNSPDKLKAKPGPQTILSESEEQAIVNWIFYRAEHGSPVTKTELLDSVQAYVKSLNKPTPFTNSRPSRHWYEAFRKRNPQLSIRKPQHLSLSRASVTREDLKEWFQDVEEILKKKDLLNISPNRIYNCDETNVVLCPESEKVLTSKGSRSVYQVVDAGKEGLTVLFMYSASGLRAPPMLMYAYKEEVPKKIVENTPKGWDIGISDNGWMTSETFYEYITNVFHPWLVKEEVEFPVVIYHDNHSSYITIPLVAFCKEYKIEIIGLYPNSTHIMQPLDIAYFHPFKEAWKKAVPKWKHQHNIRKLKKEDFPLVLKFTLDNMKEEGNVAISGFKGAGLFPFNPNAIDYDVLNKKKKSKQCIKNFKEDDFNTRKWNY